MIELINFIVHYLGLKGRYSIKLQHTLRSGSRAEYSAIYSESGKLRKHEIVIATKGIEDDARSLNTLIAHEFIHAWQTEYKPNSAVHGKIFQKMARDLQIYLTVARVPDIGEIYLKGIDETN